MSGPCEFYRDGLGFESKSMIGTESDGRGSGADGAVAVLELESGAMISLYEPHVDPREGRSDYTTVRASQRASAWGNSCRVAPRSTS